MDKNKHLKLINDLLKYINENANDFILKGGTALMCCYGLDRFSADIDLDGKRKLETIIKNFCKSNNLEYNIKKDTEFVERFMIHYDQNESLKVEISHRKFDLYQKQSVVVNSINTYSIQDLFSFKIDCLNQRTKIRDFYDVCFIYNNYKTALKHDDIYRLEDFLNKNEENYYEYLINTQNDEYIDKNKFENYYIKMLLDFTNAY